MALLQHSLRAQLPPFPWYCCSLLLLSLLLKTASRMDCFLMELLVAAVAARHDCDLSDYDLVACCRVSTADLALVCWASD
jgi:hypothetical protein